MRSVVVLFGCGLLFFIFYIIISLSSFVRFMLFLCVLGVIAIYVVVHYIRNAIAFDRDNPR